MENRVTDLFKIKYPIIQAGMVWCSGWELASVHKKNVVRKKEEFLIYFQVKEASLVI